MQSPEVKKRTGVTLLNIVTLERWWSQLQSMSSTWMFSRFFVSKSCVDSARPTFWNPPWMSGFLAAAPAAVYRKDFFCPARCSQTRQTLFVTDHELHNRHSNHTNYSVTTPKTISNKCLGGHQRRHNGMSLLFSKTGWQAHFIVSFVTAPFHSYYRMSLYSLDRPLHFKHVGVNVRLRLTDIQSIRSVSKPSWGSWPNFSLARIFNIAVI